MWRAHRQESFAVYNRDSRHGDIPRRAGVGGPGGTTRTFVPQLARTRTRTRGRVPRLSFVGVHRVRFESRHPLAPPIRGHAHDTRPRTPGGAFNARSLSSARERAARRGLKRTPAVGSIVVFLHRPSPGHPLLVAVRCCSKAYLSRERSITSSIIDRKVANYLGVRVSSVVLKVGLLNELILQINNRER